ncbi:MAG: SpoIID/LytB domain-containing protein [Bacteroidales bacterium]
MKTQQYRNTSDKLSIPYYKTFTLLALLLCSLFTQAEKVDVGLFFDTPVRIVNFSVQSGDYVVIVNDTLLIASMDKGQAMVLIYQNKRIHLKINGVPMGAYKSVKAIGSGDEGTFNLMCTQPSLPQCTYAQHADFKVAKDGGGLLIINNVDEQIYLRGVVESESGTNAEYEFYKAQGLLARTYLYAHYQRHKAQGFNLCDGVHCQAYKGILKQHKPIRKAINSTAGTVVVDSSLRPIVATYHANCGGETANSEDVWKEAIPYLRSTTDNYCKLSAGAAWQRKIPLSVWKNYMAGYGIHVKNPKHFESKQHVRKTFYVVNRKKVKFTRIRGYFGLRSAFFDVRAENNFILLTGRGYGHGVGMCQEGAMRMAEEGFSCESILEQFYPSVQLLRHSELSNDQMEYFMLPSVPEQKLH